MIQQLLAIAINGALPLRHAAASSSRTIIEEARRGYQLSGAINAQAFLLGIYEGNESGVPGRI
jgi:hypothetical protein